MIVKEITYLLGWLRNKEVLNHLLSLSSHFKSFWSIFIMNVLWTKILLLSPFITSQWPCHFYVVPAPAVLVLEGRPGGIPWGAPHYSAVMSVLDHNIPTCLSLE